MSQTHRAARAAICGAICAVTCAVSCGGEPTPGARPAPRAIAWLRAAQDDDGLFRSPAYGALRRGESTAAAIALALARLPDDDRAAARDVLDRALTALDARDAPTPAAPPEPVDYPCYTAAHRLHALTILRPDGASARAAALVTWLRSRQLHEATGCAREAPEYGGFGLGAEVPAWPDGAGLVGLSTTTAVVEALAAAGVPADDAALQRARVYVERCQSYGGEGADGGFRFAPGGDWRATKAGFERDGDRERPRSYGTATADGVRALLACGADAGSPRVRAALDWLDEHGGDLVRVPGMQHAPDATLEPSLRLYWWASLAALARALPDHPAAARWREVAAREALRLQRDDGRFVGLGDRMKEDDPLVATALALLCLAGR